MKIVLTVVPVVLLTVAGGVAFFFPGGPEDRGTPWNKFLWQCHMSAAQWCGDHGDLKGARQQFREAESLTKTFHDKSSRLLATLTLEADVYRTLKDFDAVSKANQRFIATGASEVEQEAAGVQQWLTGFHEREKVDPISCQAALQAGATRIRYTVDKLHGRGLYDQEEKLLNVAITEYNTAGLGQSREMADFKSALADCMLLQQNLEKVRPLLAEVLHIRETRIAVMGGFSSPAAADSILELIKALLKIGEFDRDQSNFTESQSEFARAKKLLNLYGKDNIALNQEYTMSTADLERQIRLDCQRRGAAK